MDKICAQTLDKLCFQGSKNSGSLSQARLKSFNKFTQTAKNLDFSMVYPKLNTLDFPQLNIKFSILKTYFLHTIHKAYYYNY